MYEVMTGVMDLEIARTQVRWLLDNFKHDSFFPIFQKQVVVGYVFTNEEDAVAFKLRWM